MNNKPVVLYVEDDPRSRRVMNLIMLDMGITEIVMFEDSTDFQARVSALVPKPDVIFLDIHMKPHTGFEMLEMLRKMQQFEGVPVVAMTASVMNEEVQQLRSSGFDGCLAKPIDMDSFPDTLARIVRGERVWRIIN